MIGSLFILAGVTIIGVSLGMRLGRSAQRQIEEDARDGLWPEEWKKYLN